MSVEVKDMGLLVDRGVGGPQGLFLSSIAELAHVIRAISNIADTSSLVSAVLFAANDAALVPIIAGANVTVKTGWWYNGAATSGNVDVGLYDHDLKRLTSTGAVAQDGTVIPQSAALTVPYDLRAGRLYYLALSASSATAQFECLDTGAITNARILGLARATSAHPLPTEATPVAFSQKQVPIFGLTYRTGAI